MSGLPRPLSGIRVVDLSRLLPGPMASLLLADLGAEVIKVEEPPLGDPLRQIPPVVAGSSLLFHALNRGKRFVTIDLRTGSGRDRLLRLLETADCLVESFRPDVLPRLGLDPLDLAARFDRLVIARLSGFGLIGPCSGRPGHDIDFMALAGTLAGLDSPWPLPVQVADCGAAMLAAMHIMAALIGRIAPGAAAVDRILDCPILDAALLFAMPIHARTAGGETVDSGAGLLEGGLSTYRRYVTRDERSVAVGAIEPQFQRAIETAFGGVDETSLLRGIGAMTLAEVEALALPCVEPVLRPPESSTHPAIQARVTFAPMITDEGTFMLPLSPFAAGVAPGPGPWAAPPGSDDDVLS